VFHYDQRVRAQAAMEDFFTEFDLVICPVATTTAFHPNQQVSAERMLQVNGQPRESTDSMFWAGYGGSSVLPQPLSRSGATIRACPLRTDHLRHTSQTLCAALRRVAGAGVHSFESPDLQVA
jgi:hypothetical protein